MEADHSSVTVTFNYGALKNAEEALATLLISALVKAQLLAPATLGMLMTNTPRIKGEYDKQSKTKPLDAEGDDGDGGDGGDDDDWRRWFWGG
ncbi:prostatic spermine-binding protein-like isoform X1 [Quillaja saponaria]|uniref:Prostatic spermine-binding protein-like isoform X1 n=1 Tax=Quillaja saponaria TaxID=32244 RepID=A0AAD7LEW2_QUISA|nr:prostatic spermine-binding protein-like isoform X1 [Quillaja saponaria]